MQSNLNDTSIGNEKYQGQSIECKLMDFIVIRILTIMCFICQEEIEHMQAKSCIWELQRHIYTNFYV